MWGRPERDLSLTAQFDALFDALMGELRQVQGELATLRGAIESQTAVLCWLRSEAIQQHKDEEYVAVLEDADDEDLEE